MFEGAAGLTVVGIRHHSPACARLVRQVLHRVRPRQVLIEGPADMNDRLDELLLPHALPIAIFTSYKDGERSHASWSPFCDYSPEWVALREAKALGARAQFIDLPAWHPAFHGVENRYADGQRRELGAVEALCKALGIEGMDPLWDHLFEQPLDVAVLSERLRVYFEQLRREDPPGDRDTAREAFMREGIRAALAQGGPLVVVCGGYHAQDLAAVQLDPSARAPQTPSSAGARSYLVPYSFRRLDAFTGYQSGMPSPQFYQAVWEEGPERAPDSLMQASAFALRARGQQVSAADLIAASAMSEGLRRMRGHAVLSRTDLLDGFGAALVKDSLDAPLPWTRRGVPGRETHPLLAEVLRVFSGDRRGRLADGTPIPPLLADALEAMDRHGITSASARRVKVDLRGDAGRERSRVFHRLRVLRVPGIEKLSGPTFPTEGLLDEQWDVRRDDDAEAALIEASGYGASLEEAAMGRLEEALVTAGDLSRLALLLAESLFTGAPRLTGRVLSQVSLQAARETDFGRLGEALARLSSLWRHDVLLGAKGARDLAAILDATFDRGLWLLEHLAGPTQPSDPGVVQGIRALRDFVVHIAAKIAAPVAPAERLFRRRIADPQAPPAVRGACLGALWSSGLLGEDAADIALGAVRLSARPQTLGDFLSGLFPLAREEVSATPSLTSALDALLSAFDEKDFLVAAPSLRLAFSYFPPREKLEIARAVLVLHGRDPLEAAALANQRVDVGEVQRGAALDAAVEEVLQRHGLGPEVPDDVP